MNYKDNTKSIIRLCIAAFLILHIYIVYRIILIWLVESEISGLKQQGLILDENTPVPSSKINNSLEKDQALRRIISLFDTESISTRNLINDINHETLAGTKGDYEFSSWFIPEIEVYNHTELTHGLVSDIELYCQRHELAYRILNQQISNILKDYHPIKNQSLNHDILTSYFLITKIKCFYLIEKNQIDEFCQSIVDFNEYIKLYKNKNDSSSPMDMFIYSGDSLILTLLERASTKVIFDSRQINILQNLVLEELNDLLLIKINPERMTRHHKEYNSLKETYHFGKLVNTIFSTHYFFNGITSNYLPIVWEQSKGTLENYSGVIDLKYLSLFSKYKKLLKLQKLTPQRQLQEFNKIDTETKNLLYPNLQSLEHRLILIAKFRTALTSLAIAQYDLKYGRLPDSLETLVPEFLDTIPIDPHTDTPLIYSRNTNGYTVYTRGSDQEDHGGIKMNLGRQVLENGSDIVFEVIQHQNKK